MSYFAEIKDGVVQRIIVAEQDYIDSGSVGDSSSWIETSITNDFRKVYASINYTYDSANDVFIPPQPYPSWSLDSNFDWQAPVAKPTVSVERDYVWDESTTSWDF